MKSASVDLTKAGSRTDRVAAGALAVFPFLDAWRLIAALVVTLLHLQAQGFLTGAVPDLFRIAHLGVIVFFVISGYSVAFAADARRGQPVGFLVARWSRVYSIAIPALVLALALDFLANAPQNPLYPGWQYRRWWLHFGFHALFLGELWTFALRPFSIIPYWSLAYEFWFYMLMAAFLLRPGRWRTLCIVALLILMGPRLLLLLPCWLLGVLACRRRTSVMKTVPRVAWGASAFFVLALTLWVLCGADAALMEASMSVDRLLRALSSGALRLQYSRWFLADYGVALLFTAALWMVARAAPVRSAPARGLQAVAARLAPHTFGLYLFHHTLILFAASQIPAAQRQGAVAALVCLGVVVVGFVLSMLLTPGRSWWAKVFEGGFRMLPGKKAVARVS